MKVKSLFVDLVGLSGLAALSYGAYLEWGLSVALMASGSLLLGFAVVVKR